MRLATEEHPVMLAEPSDNTREAREKAVQLMFEKYNVPGEPRGAVSALLQPSLLRDLRLPAPACPRVRE